MAATLDHFIYAGRDLDAMSAQFEQMTGVSPAGAAAIPDWARTTRSPRSAATSTSSCSRSIRRRKTSSRARWAAASTRCRRRASSPTC